MNREPSIHILKGDLIKVLEKVLPLGVDCEGFARELLRLSKPYSISSRNTSITNEHFEKKALKLVKSTTNDANLFAQLVYYTRKKLHHKGLIPIKPGGKQWELVKEITSQAVDFNNVFNLERRAGFVTYIELGIKKMGKFSLNRFPSLHEKICESYESESLLLKDPTPNDTLELYKIFYAKILENTGIQDNSSENPEKYIWFVKAKHQANEMGVSYKVYMNAQFEGLDFVRGIPHPTQMVGDKAKERVIRYVYKYNLHNSNGKSKTKDWLDLNKIFKDE